MPEHKEPLHTAEGRRRIFEDVYISQRKHLIAYVLTILGGDVHAAEDAVDEAFTDIWRRCDDLAEKLDNPAWLRRVVRNKAVDYLRKVGGREESLTPALIATTADEAQTPEHAALLSDERAWLRGALSVLNVDQREVVVMCYFEGRSLQDIAALSNCPVGTVKTRLHYARAKLRDWMGLASNLAEPGTYLEHFAHREWQGAMVPN